MDVEELIEEINEIINNEGYSLVLYNDDINTFEHVIACLVTYVSHTQVQAEQCAMIAHHKGKCSIKNDNLNKLLALKDVLTKNKLIVKIE
jgi:ATP-dependent Clp protease adaptor protein ClpS